MKRKCTDVALFEFTWKNKIHCSFRHSTRAYSKLHPWLIFDLSKLILCQFHNWAHSLNNKNNNFNIKNQLEPFVKRFFFFLYFQSCAECLGTALKGPLGNPEPLSSCTGCGMSLHSTCANNAAKTDDVVPLATLVKKGSKWFCDQCKSTCESCQRTDVGVCVLGCCACEKNYHLSCLDPVPEKKPKCPWR